MLAAIFLFSFFIPPTFFSCHLADFHQIWQERVLWTCDAVTKRLNILDQIQNVFIKGVIRTFRKCHSDCFLNCLVFSMKRRRRAMLKAIIWQTVRVTTKGQSFYESLYEVCMFVCLSVSIGHLYLPIGSIAPIWPRATLNRDTEGVGGKISDLRRLAACWPIMLKFKYVVPLHVHRQRRLQVSCTFHADRLNDRVII